MITLETLRKASAQDVFDQVKNHLLTQGEKCETSYGMCCYRIGSLKCAAGCLIWDDEYKDDFESIGWETLVTKFNFPSKHDRLIIDLQQCHDENDVDDWEEELKKVAKKHDLKF